MELNKKCIEILQYLIKRNDYVKTEELAEIYNVTERSIRYNVDKIESFLVKNGFKYLDRKHNMGVRILNEEGLDEFLKGFIKAPTPFKYNYSKEERFKYIVSKVLQSDDPVNISELQNSLCVSKNTVLKELDEIEEWLKRRNLSLIRKPRVGISVEGSEYDKRKTIIELVSETVSTEDILNYVNRRMAQSRIKNLQFDVLFEDMDVDFLDGLIRKAETELGKKFSDDAYGGLLTHIAIMIKRIQLNKTIYLPQVYIKTGEESSEYRVAKSMINEIEKQYGIVVPDEETSYIVLHLSGARIFEDDLSKLDGEDHDDEIYNIAKLMTNEIEKLYNADFGEDKERVIQGLVTHLRPGLFRMKYNKKLVNPLHNEIKANYGQLFIDTMYAARHLEEYLGQKVDEHEISYITMHFGAALENAKHNRRAKSKVVIVCGTGIGTARMVASQIANEFDVEIVDTISCREMNKVNGKNYDAIISTVEIPNLEGDQYIRISPLLSNRDFEKLGGFLKARYRKWRNEDNEIHIVNRFINVVEKYCTIQDREHLKYELLYEIKKVNKNMQEGRFIYMLSDLLTQETVRINVDCKDWVEAIKAGTEVLVEKGYVETKYEEAIIENFKTLGPYMVVAPGIVLSHARPENGVNTLSMSLTTLKEPVKFGNETNDPVKLVITVAAVDNETHLKALSQLMELFMNGEDMNVIFTSTNKEDVIKVINKYSN